MDYVTPIRPRKRNLLDFVAFTFILCLVIVYRSQLLTQFSFVYTDSDQTIMWEALRNYSEGAFHEPRFYGQAYNTFLEAFVAIPFYRAGIPAYKALPIVSVMLALLPFVLVSFFTLLHRSVLHALIILTIPLMLPHEYGLITSMPRGFVTGIFFAGIGCISVLFPKKNWAFSFLSFTTLLGYIANSNAVLLSAACLFYLFLINFKNYKFYTYSFAGALPGGILLWFMDRFYATHPFNNLHGFKLSYTSDNFVSAFGRLQDFFGFNTPVCNHSGIAIFILLALVAIFFAIKKQYIKASATLFIILLLILPLGLNKLSEGTDSLYFHYSRMFLSVPLLLAFCLMLFEPVYEPSFLYTWCIAANYFFNDHTGGLPDTVNKIATKKAIEVVTPARLEHVFKTCYDLNQIAKKNKIELVVMVNHYFNDVFTYGCPSCTDRFPETMRPAYERRTWKLLEAENKVYKTVLFVDELHTLKGRTVQLKNIPQRPELYLLENNSLKTMSLFDSLGVRYRRFR